MALTRYAVLLALLAGCASISAPPRSAVRDPAIQACDQWFAALNEETRRAGVRDAGAWMIPAFPYLRADRYTASFGAAARRKPDAAAQWVERMRALDQEARTVEIANLPAASLDKLEAGGRGSALARTQECGRQLMAADAGDALQQFRVGPFTDGHGRDGHLAGDHLLGQPLKVAGGRDAVREQDGVFEPGGRGHQHQQAAAVDRRADAVAPSVHRFLPWIFLRAIVTPPPGPASPHVRPADRRRRSTSRSAPAPRR